MKGGMNARIGKVWYATSHSHSPEGFKPKGGNNTPNRPVSYLASALQLGPLYSVLVPDDPGTIQRLEA